MPSTLTAFFDRYRRAFAERDLEALVGFFHVPCMVLSDHAVATPQAADTLRTRLAAQFERHAEAGVAAALFQILDHRRLDARYVQADVRWQLQQGDGSALATFDLMYLIAASDHGWRIVLVAPLESISDPD